MPLALFSAIFAVVCTTSVLLAESVKLQVVTENWRPYNYLENGEIKGTSTEIVKRLLDKAGFPYEIQVLPWARAYLHAQTQENVLIYTIIRIAPREGQFHWIARLGEGGTTSLYKLKGSQDINPDTIEDAKKFLIVTNIKSMDHLWLEHNHFFNLHLTPKVENAINVFFLKRADMIAFDDAVMEKEFKHLGHDPAKEVRKVMPLFRTYPYLAASLKTSERVVEKLRKTYETMQKEGGLSYSDQ